MIIANVEIDRLESDKTLVVSQPMYFPWPGIFEQMRLADYFAHYDDVQLPLGRSFMSRVQIKTEAGIKWLTVPVLRKQGQLICEARLDNHQPWKDKQLAILQHAYAKAPFKREMLDLVEEVFRPETDFLSDLNIRSMETVAKYLKIETQFSKTSELNIKGKSTERLIDLTEYYKCGKYLTGHGARQYLDHEKFEAKQIEVRYMDYLKIEYSQLHQDFTPFVSILDAIACLGPDARQIIASDSLNWRNFLERYQ